MDLITIIIVLIVVGLLAWAIAAYLPIPQPFKNIVILLVIVIACLWLLRVAGVV
jgi:hypothetical protein